MREIGNPFAENKIPSVSMFAKERKKHIQATPKVVADLEEKFGTKEYLGVKMNYETLTFFKGLVSRVGEEASMKIVENGDTRINDAGALTRLYCNNTQITSLPELPAGLTELHLTGTPLAKDQAFLNELEKKYPKLSVHI